MTKQGLSKKELKQVEIDECYRQKEIFRKEIKLLSCGLSLLLKEDFIESYQDVLFFKEKADLLGELVLLEETARDKYYQVRGPRRLRIRRLGRKRKNGHNL